MRFNILPNGVSVPKIYLKLQCSRSPISYTSIEGDTLFSKLSLQCIRNSILIMNFDYNFMESLLKCFRLNVSILNNDINSSEWMP